MFVNREREKFSLTNLEKGINGLTYEQYFCAYVVITF